MNTLEQPLNPELDYFDATPSMEQLLEKMVELHRSIQLQLSINTKLMDNISMLRSRIEKLEGKKLILPRHMN